MSFSIPKVMHTRRIKSKLAFSYPILEPAEVLRGPDVTPERLVLRERLAKGNM